MGGLGPVKLPRVLRWVDIAERFHQALRIEPRDPFQRGESDRLQNPPGPIAVNDFGLEGPDDGFGQRVVVGVAGAPNGWARSARSVYPNREV